MHAKLGGFLQRVSSGQIINRFTKDIDKIDTVLGSVLSVITLEMTLVIMDIIVVIWTTNQLLLMIPCFLFVIFALAYQRKYMRLKRELTRLQNITNSPVIGWCTAVLKSCAEVRVLKKENYVRKIFIDFIDENTKNSLINYGLDAWFQTRITILNLVLVLIPSYSYVFYSLYTVEGGEGIDIQKLIMFVLGTTKLTADMGDFMVWLSQFETSMVSVERCQAFEELEVEDNYKDYARQEKLYTMPKRNAITEILKNDSKVLFPLGKVELVNLTAKYPTKSTSVLKKLNLVVQPAEKIGIVGRTGAGKTSFIKLFWKCLDSQEGQLLIDGKDIETLDLKSMRREIMVISQETALFAGTLRENIEPTLEYMFGEKDIKKSKKKRRATKKKLDPFEEEMKEKVAEKEKWIVEVLGELGFGMDKIEKQGLDFEIDAGGDNLSQGEKQIVCFVRALAEKKKVIILDEATAAIDLKTEQAIQKRIESDFKDSTMFIIAHRIQTVLSCDKILVLDDGYMKEFDTPQNLLKNPDSDFSQIYQKLQDMKQ